MGVVGCGRSGEFVSISVMGWRRKRYDNLCRECDRRFGRVNTVEEETLSDSDSLESSYHITPQVLTSEQRAEYKRRCVRERRANTAPTGKVGLLGEESNIGDRGCAVMCV